MLSSENMIDARLLLSSEIVLISRKDVLLDAESVREWIEVREIGAATPWRNGFLEFAFPGNLAHTVHGYSTTSRPHLDFATE